MKPLFMLKRFLRSEFGVNAAAAAINGFIRLVHATSRWELIGRDHYNAAYGQGKGVIVAFWHGRLMMIPGLTRETGLPLYMLISTHRDGEIIARAVKNFGVNFIRGSAADPKKPGRDKGGASAVAQMTAALEQGAFVGFTPDGPKGPGEKVKPGIIRLAQMTGAPIWPITYSTSRGRRLSGWDRFLLAMPFSKGYYMSAAPITVAADASEADLEAARAKLEAALIAVTAEADARAGRKDEDGTERP